MRECDRFAGCKPPHYFPDSHRPRGAGATALAVERPGPEYGNASDPQSQARLTHGCNPNPIGGVFPGVFELRMGVMRADIDEGDAIIISANCR
jgi:hypothetical protein